MALGYLWGREIVNLTGTEKGTASGGKGIMGTLPLDVVATAFTLFMFFSFRRNFTISVFYWEKGARCPVNKNACLSHARAPLLFRQSCNRSCSCSCNKSCIYGISMWAINFAHLLTAIFYDFFGAVYSLAQFRQEAIIPP